MNRRAVVYARVSSDDVRAGKERRNLDEQIRMGREYSTGKGYVVVAELAEDDRGASGASLDLEQLNRAFAMARAGEYDVLVVRELDRLSRGLAKQLIIEEELKRAGVEIEYVLARYDDNPEGNLSKQIKAVISEYERLKINERMTRGRRLKARAGNIVARGQALYGYDLCNRDEKVGYEINEKEAEIVRLIFTWYAGGMSIRHITHELARLGIPTPGADAQRTYHKLNDRAEWGRSSVHAILQNETYTGSWYYGKQSPKTPNSKQVKRNDRQTWIKVDVPVIIPPELWETTRRRLGSSRARGGNNVKRDYLLRGHVICGACGARMAATSNHRRGKYYGYYVCRIPRAGFDHRGLTYPAGRVDEVVWEWVKQLLLNPEAIREGLAAYKQQQEERAGPISMHVSAINGLLIERQAELRRLLDLYLSGEFSRDLLVDKRAELEKAIGDLERERAALLASMRGQSITDEQEETLLDFARKVSKGLDCADSDFRTRRGIIEALGVEVTLMEDGSSKILRIKCVLGKDDKAHYVLSPNVLDELSDKPL